MLYAKAGYTEPFTRNIQQPCSQKHIYDNMTKCARDCCAGLASSSLRR
jgi:hypothetical protein